MKSEAQLMYEAHAEAAPDPIDKLALTMRANVCDGWFAFINQHITGPRADPAVAINGIVHGLAGMLVETVENTSRSFDLDNQILGEEALKVFSSVFLRYLQQGPANTMPVPRQN